MIPFPSKLEVYCINLNKHIDSLEKTKMKLALEIRKPKKNQFPVAIKKKKVQVKLTEIEKKYGLSFAHALKGAEGMLKNGQLHIIETKNELSKYVNGNNNNWSVYVEDEKKIQFYIKHPKKGKENILIEAESFYGYVESEYNHELINYCTSHCNLKGLIISKVEEKSYDAQLNSSKGNVGFSRNSKKGNICYMSYAEAFDKQQPLSEYNWLEKEFMDCVNSLSKGAQFSNSYECDLTTGISADYVKAISLNAKAHKKFRYYISIQC